MLLTLATRTFAGQSVPGPTGEVLKRGPDAMYGLPRFAIEHLQLRGLSISASMLSGWGLPELDRLRDQADRVGCPCLVLIEDAPLPFGATTQKRRDSAGERIRRLGAAAHRLGCNSLAIKIEGKDDDVVFERAAAEVKRCMPALERLELNLLLAPAEGLTFQPERLTDLIKKIGGFRIGSLPDFGHAHATGDTVGTLRKLAPFAGAVHATVDTITDGQHTSWDLRECVEAIESVGFANTLAIDYIGKGDAAAAVETARVLLANESLEDIDLDDLEGDD